MKYAVSGPLTAYQFDRLGKETGMMRHKKAVFSAIILFVAVLFLSHLYAAEKPVQFSWAVLTDTPDGLRPVDFNTPVTLSSGTTIQIYLEQKPNTYIYLYLIDSQGNLNFLFPETNFYDSVEPVDKIFRIPPEMERFVLTPPGGQEKFYLMASSSRLVDLEKLTAAFLKSPQNREQNAAVINEIKRIRR